MNNNKFENVMLPSIYVVRQQVEQFWGYYSFLVRPGDLSGHSDIHLFKDGIKPMWEVSWLLKLLPASVKTVLLQPTAKR